MFQVRSAKKRTGEPRSKLKFEEKLGRVAGLCANPPRVIWERTSAITTLLLRFKTPSLIRQAILGGTPR